MTANLPPVRGKLVLPTVETCPHRRVVETSGSACCDLLREISGVAEHNLCEVQRDACAACCQSFPPTVPSWNLVMASLVYDLTERVLNRGGDGRCTVSEAQRLQTEASAILETVVTSNTQVIPLRSRQPCGFLGERSDTSSPESATDLAATAATYRCRHPAHGQTTLDNCRSCRDWSDQPPVSRRMSLPELVPPPKSRSGQTVRHWSVGVVTAPRREATLEWCLDSLVRAGWDRPHLFVDGLMRIPERHARLPITWRESPVGAWPNFFLALSEMVQRDPAAEAYLLLQDDAVLFDGGPLREYLETTLWPGDRPGLVSLYCPQPYTVLEPGWHGFPGPWIWGALAFVFPRELAREFISNPDVIAHRWSGRHEGKAQVDVLIGEWAKTLEHTVHYPSPSLTQHVGNTSSIWHVAANHGFRRADWFAGDVERPFSHNAHWSDFPEDSFPCRDANRSEYSRRIALGRERMAASRLVICGLCRNVRHFLPKLAARIERLGEMFRDYRVVLFENDSTDATVEFLCDWQRVNYRVHLLSEPLGHGRFPRIRSAERATRLAEYRNRYRKYALEHFADFDHVLVCDTDLAGGWSGDGLANTFGQDDWDFVGSSGWLRIHGEKSSDTRQFDAWAFRAVNHPQPHLNEEVNSLFFERGEPMLPVWSCFGGVGVYRMEAMRAAEYGGPDCEHVVLHQRLRQAGFGRLFLNPSQIVLYSPE